MEANRRELLKEYIEYRILLEGQVYYMRQQCYLRNEEEDGNIVLKGIYRTSPTYSGNETTSTR